MAFHKCGIATGFKQSFAELEGGAPQPVFRGERNGFPPVTHRTRRCKLEVICPLRINVTYSNDSSNR
jgi:hypothetical protein